MQTFSADSWASCLLLLLHCSIGSGGVSEHVGIAADIPRSVWIVGDAERWTAVCAVSQQSLLNSVQTQGTVVTVVSVQTQGTVVTVVNVQTQGTVVTVVNLHWQFSASCSHCYSCHSGSSCFLSFMWYSILLSVFTCCMIWCYMI